MFLLQIICFRWRWDGVVDLTLRWPKHLNVNWEHELWMAPGQYYNTNTKTSKKTDPDSTGGCDHSPPPPSPPTAPPSSPQSQHLPPRSFHRDDHIICSGIWSNQPACHLNPQSLLFRAFFKSLERELKQFWAHFQLSLIFRFTHRSSPAPQIDFSPPFFTSPLIYPRNPPHRPHMRTQFSEQLLMKSSPASNFSASRVSTLRDRNWKRASLQPWSNWCASRHRTTNTRNSRTRTKPRNRRHFVLCPRDAPKRLGAISYSDVKLVPQGFQIYACNLC